MQVFPGRQNAAKRITAIVVCLGYAAVVSGADLFHNEHCRLHLHSPADDISSIYSDEPCPVCMFWGNSLSVATSYEVSLGVVEYLFFCEILPHSTIVGSRQWTCSISLRAPPDIVIS